MMTSLFGPTHESEDVHRHSSSHDDLIIILFWMWTGIALSYCRHYYIIFLTGAAPDREDVEGEYPTVVESPSGKSVPIVQAYTRGKYLGNLDVTFNTEGDITNWGGNPILLNGSIPRGKDNKMIKATQPGQNYHFYFGSVICFKNV